MIDLRVVVDEDGHTVRLCGSHIDEPGGVILRECRSPEKAQVFAAEVMVALVPLLAENARLREALLTFARLAGPADIDPSEDGTGKTTVAEFVKRVLESK